MTTRLLELVKSDEELHVAVLALLGAMTEAKLAQAEWRRSRIRAKPEG